jgi:tRNA A37 threonylcarbamoyladenosine dehydratase
MTATGIDALFNSAKIMTASVGRMTMSGMTVIFSGVGSWQIKNQTKSTTSTFTGSDKNSISPTNSNKNSASFTNLDKS